MSVSNAQVSNAICKLVCSEQLPIMSCGCELQCSNDDACMRTDVALQLHAVLL